MRMYYKLKTWNSTVSTFSIYQFYRQRKNCLITYEALRFDPNDGPSSGAARLTHSTTELQRACVRRAAPEDGPSGSKHVVPHMLINSCRVDCRIGIY
jgi:hypothetical protein